jgi:hypothetical protein
MSNIKSSTPKVANKNDPNTSDANKTPYPVATYTLAISDEQNLTKQYDLDNGVVKKTRPGLLVAGTVRTVTKSIDQLIDEIQRETTPHHALIHGVCGHDEIRVVTKGNETADAISRIRDYFSYGPNALLMFDHDPSERGKNFTFENSDDYLNTLAEECPEIADAAFVVKPSTSSGIMLNGKSASKQGGFHAYTVVLDGSDIPRFIDILFKRLIIKGYGYVFISKSGSSFVRTIFDKAVYQPERLDYIAPATVGEGLIIHQPPPQKFEGGYLDTSKMPDLTAEEEALYQVECSRLMDEAREGSKAVREAYLSERSTTTGIPIQKLKKQYEQGDQGVIDYEMPLTRNDGTQFSFTEVIADPSKYNNLSMRDPFEPDYGDDKAKLFINTDGSVNVHSYCHGEHTYRLYKDGALYPQASLGQSTAFKLIGIKEILTQPPPLQWLLKDYILRASQCHNIGDSTFGKTFYSIGLGLSIATGNEFMGKRVTQGPVVYINAEGHTGIRWRIKAWEQEFVPLANAPFYLSEQSADFLDSHVTNSVKNAIDSFAQKHDGRIEAIFVDTLHRNMSGEEDSSKDFGLFMNNLESLCRRYGAAGIVNHHPGHNNKGRGRGSSSQRASLDTELLLIKEGGRTVLKHIKLKDGGPTQPPIGYRLKQVTIPWPDIDGNPLTTCVPEFYPVDGKESVSKKRGPVPKNPAIAITSLVKAMNGTATAAKDQWRAIFFKDYKGSNDAMKKAFTRSLKELVDNGVVVTDGPDTYRIGDYSDCPWTDVSDYLPSTTSHRDRDISGTSTGQMSYLRFGT